MGHKVFETAGVPVRAWVEGVELAENAIQQLRNLAALPFVHKWIAVMPDAHLGKGATVGSVVATRHAVIPAAVGVDLGCGMMAVRTSLTAEHLPDDLSPLRSAIERAVPHGRTDNGGANDRGAFRDPPPAVLASWATLAERFERIGEKHPKIRRGVTVQQLGTLGTGNHFIELNLDEASAVWVMLHSGSRGVGNRIGTYFIGKAKEEMRRFFVNLPDADLAYLPEGSEYFADYLEAVSWAQDFAFLNRERMMDAALLALAGAGAGVLPPFERTLEAVNCHHNYVAREKHYGESVLVTRKGAIRARAGDLGIIPGSMGAKSFIVRGKGNPESFCSSSHGAGRRMSRAEARRRFTVADHEAATAGIECRKDAEVIDETPGAYKSIEAVMEAQRELVDVVHTLKQVLVVKG